MNIFAVSKHPRKCARALDDLRLNKMMLETTQILCTMINHIEGRQATPYKSSHSTGPVLAWVKEQQRNGSMFWLYELGIAYGEEIQYRFGRKHACQLVLEGLTLNWPILLDIPSFMFKLEFYNGARHRKLGLDFTHLPVHEAYHEYLRARWNLQRTTPRKNGKIVKAKWTRRGPPSWR